MDNLDLKNKDIYDEEIKENSRLKSKEEANSLNTDPIDIKTNCGILNNEESINASGRKRGKYWVSAYVGESKNIVSFFCDSAADLSICGEDVAKLGVRKPLMNPISIRSFDNFSKQTITETVTLKLHFGNLVVSLRFYVCTTTHPIIGIDLWRNSTLNLSLNTLSEKFLIGKFSFTTKPSEEESVEELVRRKTEYKRQKKATDMTKEKNWARLDQDCTIAKNSIANVILETDKPLNPKLEYVFISMFDDDEENDKLSVPCVYINNNTGKFVIPIENKTTQNQRLKKTTALGEVKRCGDCLGDNTVLAFTNEDIEEAMKEIDEENKGTKQKEETKGKNKSKTKTINSVEQSPYKQTDSSSVKTSQKSILKHADGKNGRPPDKTVHFEQTQNVEGERKQDIRTENQKQNYNETKSKQTEQKIKDELKHDNTTNKTDQAQTIPSKENNDPVKFSTMVGLNKVSNETLIKCLKDGIEVDLKMDVKEADIGVNEDPVNIDEEIKRSESCPYWPDKEAYLTIFDLSSVEEEYLEETKTLLWNFRKCFFNEDKPEMFRKGVEMTPIEIKMKKGEEPTMRHPPRRMNDEKLAHLKQHLKTMLDRNIIEEIKDGIEDVYLNPIVMVIESRFYAKEKKRIIKSRFCLDLKHLNEHLSTVQYPLPYTDEYIKNLSQPEFDTFTNLDLTSFFYQMNVTTRSARKYLAFKCLNRVFYMKKLAMGLASAPALTQNLVEKIFKRAENTFCFVDDITCRSKGQAQHIRVDLPLCLALCSKYNLLISPKKVDLMKSSVRVLGFQLSQSAKAIADEKKQKIADMSFPITKKEALSKAAFFAYFVDQAPRLSELMSSLRRLAHPKVRFKPTDEDKKQFEELKAYLLDDRVGVIRTASTDPSVVTILFTDSSCHSIGCVACQLLPPLPNSGLDQEKKYLTIVACWSRKIDSSWSTYPVWLLELCALEESMHKLRWLVSGRKVYICTDSSTVRAWSSLELVPKDIARKIIRLQKYSYIILFIESRFNPSDWTTRSLDVEKPPCRFPRFIENRVYGPAGPIPWEKLFSKAMAEKAEDFFKRKRRQEMSEAIQPLAELEEDGQEINEEIEEITNVFQTPYEETQETKDNKKNKEEKTITNKNTLKQIIAAYTLTDELVAEGIDEAIEEPKLDGDAAKNIELEAFDDDQIEGVRQLQSEDTNITKMKEMIINNEPNPDKNESLLLNPTMTSFIKNRSLFRLNNQNILLRLWTQADGQLLQLIVVSDSKLRDLIADTHTSETSSNQHAGQRRTILAMNKRYYNINLRKSVANVINNCPICQLNNHHKSQAQKSGNKIALQPNDVGEADLCGPIGSFGRSTNGNPRYIWVYIDIHSRFLVTKVISSPSDEQIYEALLHTRDVLCGLPNRITTDNAIMKRNSKALKFVTDYGTSINHGLPNVSRCQGSVERAINSLMREVCKLHTAHPKTPFTRLVSTATYIINSTPCTNLDKGYCPKDIHFSNPPRDFLQHRGPITATQEDIGNVARTASQRTLLADVKRYLRKKNKTSPTDYNKIMKNGTICLKKRTVFPTNAARKLCYKTLFKAYKIKSRVATNSYRCTDLQTKEEMVIPGDNLIKLATLNDQEALLLCKSMEDVAARCFVNDQLRVDEEMNEDITRDVSNPPLAHAHDAVDTSRSRNARRQEPARRSERIRARQINRSINAIWNLSHSNIFD